MNEKVLINKFSNTTKIQNEDTLRINLYGFITEIILSREIFKNNKDLVNFFDSIDIKHKMYLYASRTLIIAKTIREIQAMDKKQLSLTRDKTLTYLLNQSSGSISNGLESNSINKNTKNGDYVENIINKYSRSK